MKNGFMFKVALFAAVFCVGLSVIGCDFAKSSAPDSSDKVNKLSISGMVGFNENFDNKELSSVSVTCDGAKISVTENGAYSARLPKGSLLVATHPDYRTIYTFVKEDGQTSNIIFNEFALSDQKSGAGLKVYEDGTFALNNYNERNVVIDASVGSKANDDFFVSFKVKRNLGKEKIGVMFFDSKTLDGMMFMINDSNNRIAALQRMNSGNGYYDQREWSGPTSAWRLAAGTSFGTVETPGVSDGEQHGEIEFALAKISGVFHIFAAQGNIVFYGRIEPTWYVYGGETGGGIKVANSDYFLSIASDNLEGFSSEGKPLALYGDTLFGDLYYSSVKTTVQTKVDEWTNRYGS